MKLRRTMPKPNNWEKQNKFGTLRSCCSIHTLMPPPIVTTGPHSCKEVNGWNEIGERNNTEEKKS